MSEAHVRLTRSFIANSLDPIRVSAALDDGREQDGCHLLGSVSHESLLTDIIQVERSCSRLMQSSSQEST